MKIGRGVFVSSSGKLAAWINVLDHLRIIVCTPSETPGNVGQVYSKIYRVLRILDKRIDFRKDEKLGYLSARPSCLGNTLHFTLTVRFPQLIKEPENLRHLCSVRGLVARKRSESSNAIRLSNQQSLAVTEMQTFDDFNSAVSNIIQLEKDLTMTSSIHIAAMLVSMFRRKKGRSVTVADS